MVEMDGGNGTGRITNPVSSHSLEDATRIYFRGNQEAGKSITYEDVDANDARVAFQFFSLENPQDCSLRYVPEIISHESGDLDRFDFKISLEAIE